jgi:hypothetical protein
VSEKQMEAKNEMAQTKQFESIIRRVNKETFPRRNSERRIVIDNATQKAVDKTRFFGTYTYYMVSNSTSTRNVPFISSIFPVVDAGHRKIDISIHCQINCPPGNETKLAEALYQIDKYPGNKLDEFVEQWLMGFIQDNQTDFIDNFFQIRDSLVAYIITTARNQLGLDFQAVRCVLEGENQLETIHLTLEKVLLRFMDSIEEHSFTADVTLLIDPQNKINAIARKMPKANLEQLIRREAREFFFNHVRIENVYTDHEGVENSFKAYTEKLLRHYGRRIGAILLKNETNGVSEPVKTLEKKIVVSLDVPEYPNPIKVENQIFITRQDTGKFNANKQENFEQWLEDNVRSVIKQVYFGLRYDEIIEHSYALENRVKADLRKLVERLGYSLDQIIVIPTFKELDILQKLEFSIDQEFITRDHQKVKLKVLVKAVGDKRSKKIIPYINNIQVLPGEMRSLVFDEISKHLRIIDSQEFYENFDDEENPQGTVKATLTDLISDKIKRFFDARIHYLSFDLGETEFIRLMDDLKKEWHKFEVEIRSVVDDKTNSFSAWFRVQDNTLGRWKIFQTQRFSITDIKERIIETLKSKLSARPSRDLTYKNEDSLDFAEGMIRSIAVNSVQEAFGLTIIVRDVHRNTTVAENIFDEFNQLYQDQIKDLVIKQMKAAADGDIALAKEYETRIDYLIDSNSNNRISLSVDEKPRLTSRTDDNNGNSTNNGNGNNNGK